MKLIWLSHFIPYPPRGGSRQRSFNLIRHISAKYETTLLALNMQGETAERAAEYAAELRKYCARVEIWEPPYPWRGARWWGQLMFSPFYRLHYGARALWSPALGRRWEGVLAKDPGALVHFDSIDLALYFPPAADFRKVLNHHNCESAMAERRAENERNLLKRAYLRWQAAKLLRLEREVCSRFDVNLTVSDLDTITLMSGSPLGHCTVVGNGTDTEYFHPSEAEPEPNTLVFAGSLDWYPNVSGIQFFIDKVWPLLKQQRPGIKLYLAGRNPSLPIVQMTQSDPAIELVPDPVDIRPWVWKGAIFICPIIDGGGTRLKILDALAMGKAVVSSSIGAEGLKLEFGEHLLVADKPQDFAHQVLRLLDDACLRRKLAGNGREMVRMHYSWLVMANQLARTYESLPITASCKVLENGVAPESAVKRRTSMRQPCDVQRNLVYNRQSEDKPSFSVIVPMYNSAKYLRTCLDSIFKARNSYGPVDIIAVDNGSRDQSFEIAKSEYGSSLAVMQRTGCTVAGLRNFGAAHAQGLYLSFIDSDCVIREDYFHRAAAVFASVKADATGAKCEPPQPPHWIEETWLGLHCRDKDGFVNYLNSGNFTIRKSVFDCVKGFNEALPTDEDAELGQRLKVAGFKIYEAHSVGAVHLRNPKSVMEFFRKELWRGLGLVRRPSGAGIDKVLVMSIVHAALLVEAVPFAFFFSRGVVIRACMIAVFALVVPLVSTVYRYITLRRVYRPFQSVFLYWVFFTAKACATIISITRRVVEFFGSGGA